jgi:hypothetical protein
MTKRQNITSNRDQQRPLLMQETPVLSDEIPEGPVKEPKTTKKSWRKRLFGKKGKTRGQGGEHEHEQEHEQEQEHNQSTGTGTGTGTSTGRPTDDIQITQSASSASSDSQGLPQRKEKRDDCTESTNSNQIEGDESQRPEAPVSRTPKQGPPTTALRSRSRSRGRPDGTTTTSTTTSPSPATSTGTTLSASRSTPVKGPLTVLTSTTPHSIRKTPKSSSAVVNVLKRPFGRDSVKEADQTVRIGFDMHFAFCTVMFNSWYDVM